jgi:DNA-binding NarL/FixJ family response regulator
MDQTMKMRLLFAIPDDQSLALMHSILTSALELNPLAVETAAVANYADLMQRAVADADDIILLDWNIAGPDTSNLVEEILALNPRLRVVALLPMTLHQYRRQVWCAGACNGIPKEHMDQEWLSTVLCIMHRAMEREAKLLAKYGIAEPA